MNPRTFMRAAPDPKAELRKTCAARQSDWQARKRAYVDATGFSGAQSKVTKTMVEKWEQSGGD